jgi:phenylpropionate dioxygenase-like ring-hydroxylating dioxygenase large terminal subunit
MPRGETALLLPEAYYCSEWHAREQNAVFSRHWLYVCTLAELAEPGSWITAEHGGRSWIVTRSPNGLRCFRNVCSHRHSRILAGGRGSGPLRCGYHGWTYDVEGVPTGLPGQRDNFDLSPTERLALRLPQGHVASVGNFVFMAEDPISTRPEDDMHELALDLLRNLSDTFDGPYETGKRVWAANWKAGVENTLEPYHTAFVHAESIAEVAEIDGAMALHPRFSSEFHRLKDKSRAWWQAMAEAVGFNPSPHYGDYWHFHLHPNLCIGLTYGSLLSIQTFEPLAPDRVRLCHRLFLPAAVTTTPQARRAALQQFLAEFNDRVLLEDQGPVEACQQGFPDASSRALLGESEARIGNFQRDIMTDLGREQHQEQGRQYEQGTI